MVQGLITFNYPNYEPRLWHGTLLMWAFTAITVFWNVNASLAGFYVHFAYKRILSTSPDDYSLRWNLLEAPAIFYSLSLPL
jgi:hypothetical protein